MGYSVQINGQAVFAEAGTVQVAGKIGKRAQASFTVLNTDGVTHYQQYQQVAIYDSFGALAFSGYIDQPQEQKPGYQPGLETQMTCMDQQWLAVKRLVAASYANKTCGFIAQDLLTNILAQEGVTLGLIYDGLAPSATLYPDTTLYPNGNIGLIPSAVFSYCTVAQAMDALATAASDAGVPYYWQIDQNKKFWFVPYTAVVGPTVDGTTIDQVNNRPYVIRQNPLYRNTEYVTGGVAPTVVQNEIRNGDGTAQSWTMGYNISTVPTVSTNLNGAGYVAKTVGIKGIDTGKDFYWNKGDQTITQDSAGTKLRASPLDLLQVVYTGEYPNVAIAADSGQIAYQASLDGTSGIVEVVDQDGSLTSAGDALNEASQLLTRYGVQAAQFIFSTLDSSYAPGQLCTVNYAPFGFYSSQMLVEEMSASDQTDGYNLWYTIRAIAGPYDIGWIDFFNKLLTKVSPANSINVGVSQSAVNLVSFTATITVAVDLTTLAFTCPLPATTLFPGTGVLPC